MAKDVKKKLELCPFFRWFVFCRSCKASGPQDENVEKARMFWNVRAGD